MLVAKKKLQLWIENNVNIYNVFLVIFQKCSFNNHNTILRGEISTSAIQVKGSKFKLDLCRWKNYSN